MRLNERRIVLLPQPDGPMNAVTSRSRTCERDVAHGGHAVVAHGQPAHVEDPGSRGVGRAVVFGAHVERTQRAVGHAAHHRRWKRFRSSIATAFIVSSNASSTTIAAAASPWNSGCGRRTQL